MPTTVTLDQAMQLADQDCPLPSLAGPALKLLRSRVRELETNLFTLRSSESAWRMVYDTVREVAGDQFNATQGTNLDRVLQVIRDLATAAAMEAPERCEGGTPECGPVEHHDSQGVPLCAKCWDALLADAAAAPDEDG